MEKIRAEIHEIENHKIDVTHEANFWFFEKIMKLANLWQMCQETERWHHKKLKKIKRKHDLRERINLKNDKGIL